MPGQVPKVHRGSYMLEALISSLVAGYQTICLGFRWPQSKQDEYYLLHRFGVY